MTVEIKNADSLFIKIIYVSSCMYSADGKAFFCCKAFQLFLMFEVKGLFNVTDTEF